MLETQDGAQAKVDRAKAAILASIPSVDDPVGFGLPWSVDPRLAGSQNTVGTSNRGWWYRITGGKTGCTKIGISVVTQSGNVCAAIYANSGTGRSAAPAARLATTGSLACPATGYQELALGGSVDVKHGDWIYFSADNTTASFDAAAAGGTAIANGLRGYADTAFPAPSSAPALSFGNRGFVLIAL